MDYGANDILNLKRCVKCVLPETYPNITFNNKGICNYCINHKRKYYPGEEAFDDVLEGYRNRGGKYDCLVAVSGGKDSTYALHEIVEKRGMKTLAFHFDNGTTSDGAKANIINVTQALNIEVYTITSKFDRRKKCLKNHLRAWVKNPLPDTIPMWCVGCNEGYRLGAFQVAKKIGIPLYIAGSSTIESASFKKDLIGKGQMLPFIYLFKLLQTPSYLNPFLLSTTVKDHVLRARPFWVDHLYQKHVRRLSFFTYIKYDEERILSTIRDKYDWSSGGGSASTSRTDCVIGILRDYFYNKMCGFTENDVKHSNMIREDMLTRHEAMERLEERLSNFEHGMAFALTALKRKGIEESVINKLYRGNIL